MRIVREVGEDTHGVELWSGPYRFRRARAAGQSFQHEERWYLVKKVAYDRDVAGYVTTIRYTVKPQSRKPR